MKLLFGLHLAALVRASVQTCAPECASDEICQDAISACQCNSTKYQNSSYLDLAPIVNCLSGKMVISVGKCLSERLHIDLQNTSFIGSNCTGDNNITSLNGIFVYNVIATASAAFCGNIMELNTTHVTYSNVMHIPPKYAAGVIAGKWVHFVFACTYLLNMQTSLATVLHPLANTIALSTGGSGVASTIMAAYSNPSYTTPIPSGEQDMSLGSTLYFGMSTTFQDADIFVLRVDTCYATPLPDPNSSTKVPLIENGCPANGDVYTQVVSNGKSLEARFSVEVFAFQSTGSAYIYCSARLCLNATQQCAGCSTSRSGSDKATQLSSVTVGLGPIYFQDRSASSSQTAVSWTVLGSSLLALLSLRLM